MKIARHHCDDPITQGRAAMEIATATDAQITVGRRLSGVIASCLLTESGLWQYDDPAEHAAALEMQRLFEFNLAEVDDMIEMRPWPDPSELDVTMQARSVVLLHMREGRLLDAQRWAGKLYLALRLDLRSRAARPVVRARQDYVEAQRKRSTRPRTTMSKNETDAVKFYDKLVASREERGAREAAADRFGITPKRLDVCRARVKAGKK